MGDEDATIAEIVEYARSTGLKAGDLISAKNGKGHFWCVPYRPPEMTTGQQNRIRAIFLNETLFLEIAELFNSEAGLTPSERHVVYQIVIGQNPNLAAKADGVSTETRRSQLKAAMAKLDCHSQAELVRFMISQLIHLLYLCESETSHIQQIERFGTRYFGAHGRLSVQCLPNGRVIRFWEFGPLSGRPVLVMHGYLFPFLVLGADGELNKRNIRLVLPVRRGFLDDFSASGILQLENLANDNIEDLLLFTQCIFDKPVTVLGHNMGGVYALLLAKKRPDLFSNVIIASIMLMQEEGEFTTIASRFAGGLKKLTRDTGLYELAARHIQKKIFSSEAAAKLILRRLFRDSPFDLDVVNGNRGQEAAFDWFRQIALGSVVGFSSDVNLNSGPRENFIRDIPIQINFVHGPNDPYTSIVDLENFASLNQQASCEILDEGGHYICASHPSRFWEKINNCLTDQS